MVEGRAVFPVVAVFLLLAVTGLIVTGTGCMDDEGNIYDLTGCYVGNVADLVGPLGAALILRLITLHFGPVADGQPADYAYFRAEQVAGPVGVDPSLFMEGSWQASERIEVRLGHRFESSGVTPRQTGDGVLLELDRDGDTLSGDITTYLDGVTYTGTITLTKNVPTP